jgi:hypothetical protein
VTSSSFLPPPARFGGEDDDEDDLADAELQMLANVQPADSSATSTSLGGFEPSAQHHSSDDYGFHDDSGGGDGEDGYVYDPYYPEYGQQPLDGSGDEYGYFDPYGVDGTDFGGYGPAGLLISSFILVSFKTRNPKILNQI